MTLSFIQGQVRLRHFQGRGCGQDRLGGRALRPQVRLSYDTFWAEHCGQDLISIYKCHPPLIMVLIKRGSEFFPTSHTRRLEFSVCPDLISDFQKHHFAPRPLYIFNLILQASSLLDIPGHMCGCLISQIDRQLPVSEDPFPSQTKFSFILNKLLLLSVTDVREKYNFRKFQKYCSRTGFSEKYIAVTACTQTSSVKKL